MCISCTTETPAWGARRLRCHLSRIRPGQEAAFAPGAPHPAAQAQSPGFQGYRFEPPIPGVQESGWRSCVLTASAISRRGSIYPRGRSCSKKRRRFRRVSHPGRSYGVRAVVSIGQQHIGTAGLEAKHDCAASALSGRLPVGNGGKNHCSRARRGCRSGSHCSSAMRQACCC